MLGQNGTGKTTFIRMLAGTMKPDNDLELPKLSVSYKPQKISPKFDGTVRNLLHKRFVLHAYRLVNSAPDSRGSIRGMYQHPQFVAEVMKPLNIDDLMDQAVQHLSGGELQVSAPLFCDAVL